MPRKRKTETEKANKAGFDTVQTVMTMFNDSWNFAKDNYHTEWDNYRDAYNSIRVKENYQGTADVVVPMAFSTIQTIVSGLLSDRPRFDYSLAASSISVEEFQELAAAAVDIENPSKAEQAAADIEKLLTTGLPISEEDIRVLNEFVDNLWEDDYWDRKVANWLTDMLIYGTAFLYIAWDMRTPKLINISPFDAIVDPTATDPQSAKYYGRRYLTTVDDLRSFKIIDPKTKEEVDRYKNLDSIPMGTNIPKELDKYRKEMFGGSSLKDAASRQVEVIEIWTEDKLYSIANRSVAIEDIENPTLTRSKAIKQKEPKGIIPFAAIINYAQTSLFYGKSELAPIIDQIEMLNDMTNQNLDAVSLTLNPMWHLDPKFADHSNQIVTAPGVVLPYLPGALTPVPMPVVPQNAFVERTNIKNEIREATASDQITRGVGRADDPTATEINATLAQSGVRFATKIRELEYDGFRRLGEILLEFMALFIDEPVLVRRQVGNEGRIAILDPEIFSKDIKVKVQLEGSTEQQRRADQESALQAITILTNRPEVDQVALLRKTLPKAVPTFDTEDMDDIVPEQPNGLAPTLDQSAAPNPQLGAAL